MRVKSVTKDSPIADISLEKLTSTCKGSWKVIEIVSAERDNKGKIQRTVKMQCECGYEKICKQSKIRASESCQTCYHNNKEKKVPTEIIKTKRRLKGVYKGIKRRCENIKHKDYHNYGGRGIIIENSFSTFDKFYIWVIEEGYTLECSLEVDRRNNNGGYSTENCRLVTKAVNVQNTRMTKLNWDIVNNIRYGEYNKLSDQVIGDIIGCSQSAVNKARNFKTWKEQS